MRLKNSNILMCILFLTLLTGCNGVKEKEISNYTFVTDAFSCIGTYQGAVYKGNPSGTGTFTTQNSPKGEFSCSGNWSYGKLDGEGTIRYSDGTTVEGVFVENELTGEVTVTSPDKSYAVSNYEDGIPYGVIYYYDSKGSLIGRDWYYDGVPIKTLIEDARTPEYEELKVNIYSYVNDIFKVEGKVKEIEETDSSITIKVMTEQRDIYIIKYGNTDMNLVKQCISPEFSVNDPVVFYGRYDGVGKIGIPQMIGILGYNPQTYVDDNLIDSDYAYEDIRNHPYFYGWEPCLVSGRLVSSVQDKNYYYSLLVNPKNEIYYIRSSYELNEEDFIQITGTYFGSYKVIGSEADGYESFPLILLDED